MAEFKGGVIPDSISEFGEGTPVTLVREGVYLLEITDIVGGMTRDTGDAYASFRTRIVEGPVGQDPDGPGLPIWAMQNFFEADDPTKSRAWAAGQMLSMAGLSMDVINALKGKRYAAGDAGFQQFKGLCAALGKTMKGRRLGAVITTYHPTTAGRSQQSQIARPLPTAEYEAQKAVAASRPAAQSPTPPPPNGTQPQASDTAIQDQLAGLLPALDGSPAI